MWQSFCRHGVNKSPGLASPYLRTFPLSQWFHRAFISITVTGIARKFHPIPSYGFIKPYRALLRRYTGYSFVTYIIVHKGPSVNLFAAKKCINITLRISKPACTIKPSGGIRMLTRDAFLERFSTGIHLLDGATGTAVCCFPGRVCGKYQTWGSKQHEVRQGLISPGHMPMKK